MSKDVYYFSHDSNASRDPKCAALRSDFGAEGYGIYWMMIETLAEQDGYKLEKFPKLYEGLASTFQADPKRCSSIIEAMLKDYQLLTEDDKYIWSKSLIRRMAEKEKKRQQKIEAGHIGGIKSAIKRKQNSSTAQAPLKHAGSESNQSKLNKSILKENTTPTPSKGISVPYQEITNLFNEICVSLPKVQRLTKTREVHIKARWVENPDIAVFKDVFSKVQDSDFLSGRAGQWKCCFDWIMNASNWVKISEGNYTNKESQPITKPELPLLNISKSGVK